MAEPKKWRKKPVEVEAMLFPADASPSQGMEVYHWIERNTLGSYDTNAHLAGLEKVVPESGVSIRAEDGRMVIATLEGEMTVTPGDYVIRGIQGEFYPCKPEIFEASYELADE